MSWGCGYSGQRCGFCGDAIQPRRPACCAVMASTFATVNGSQFFEETPQMQAFPARRGAGSTGDAGLPVPMADDEAHVGARSEKQGGKASFEGSCPGRDQTPGACVRGGCPLQALQQRAVVA